MSTTLVDPPARGGRPVWYVALACACAVLACLMAITYPVVAPTFHDVLAAFSAELPLLSRIALRAPWLAGGIALLLAFAASVMLALHLARPQLRWAGRVFWLLLACALLFAVALMAGLYLPILSLTQMV